MDWLIQVHQRFHLLQETLYLTVAIIDRFLQVLPPTSTYPLAGEAIYCYQNHCCYLHNFLTIPEVGPDQLLKRAGLNFAQTVFICEQNPPSNSTYVVR